MSDSKIEMVGNLIRNSVEGIEHQFFFRTATGRILLTLMIGLAGLIFYPNINTLIVLSFIFSVIGVYGLRRENNNQSTFIFSKFATLVGSFTLCTGILILDKIWLSFLGVLALYFIIVGAKTRNGILMIVSMMSLAQTIYLAYWLILKAALFNH